MQLRYSRLVLAANMQNHAIAQAYPVLMFIARAIEITRTNPVNSGNLAQQGSNTIYEARYATNARHGH